MDERLNFIKQSIDERLESINSKRLYYRRKASYIYIMTAILSGVTTILLGLKIPELNEYVRITALVITTIITILNTYNAFYNNKDLWIANNMARNRFYQLKFFIEYAEKGKQLDPNEIDSFKDQYQAILDDLNTTWQRNRGIETKKG